MNFLLFNKFWYCGKTQPVWSVNDIAHSWQVRNTVVRIVPNIFKCSPRGACEEERFGMLESIEKGTKESCKNESVKCKSNVIKLGNIWTNKEYAWDVVKVNKAVKRNVPFMIQLSMKRGQNDNADCSQNWIKELWKHFSPRQNTILG